MKKNFVIVGRVIEGIAIGMYSNIFGQLVDDKGVSINLILKSIIAIILTIVATKIEDTKKDLQ